MHIPTLLQRKEIIMKKYIVIFLVFALLLTTVLCLRFCGKDDAQQDPTIPSTGEGTIVPTDETEEHVRPTRKPTEPTEPPTEPTIPEVPTNPPACEHIFEDATCTMPKVCKLCGATTGYAAGHTWVAATCTASEFCSVCKVTTGDPLGHNWDMATCSTPRTCTWCGLTEGDIGTHKYVDGVCVFCNKPE